VLVLTVVASRRPYAGDVAFAEALSGPEGAPVMFDRWKPWLALAFVLIALAYGPTLIHLVITTPLNAPGLRVW
jgi:hypothetical protein